MVIGPYAGRLTYYHLAAASLQAGVFVLCLQMWRPFMHCLPCFLADVRLGSLLISHYLGAGDETAEYPTALDCC